VIDDGGEGENGFGTPTAKRERAITLLDAASGATLAQRVGVHGFAAHDPWRRSFLVAIDGALEGWPEDGGPSRGIALADHVLAVAATARGFVTCSRSSLDIWDAETLVRIASTPFTAAAKRTPTALRATADGALVLAEDETGGLFMWLVA
jgi:hypothetical protein